MKTVDPYYEWLGIPPKDQPPNHYRLLGLELFEENRNVIDAAANRQMSFIKEYQAGADSELSQKLLNELSAARLCLLSVPEGDLRHSVARATQAPSGPCTGCTDPVQHPLAKRFGFPPLAPLDGRVPPGPLATSIPLPAPPGLDARHAPASSDAPPTVVSGRWPGIERQSRTGPSMLAVATAVVAVGTVVAAAILGFVMARSFGPEPSHPNDAVAPEQQPANMEKPEASVAEPVTASEPPTFSPPSEPDPESARTAEPVDSQLPPPTMAVPTAPKTTHAIVPLGPVIVVESAEPVPASMKQPVVSSVIGPAAEWPTTTAPLPPPPPVETLEQADKRLQAAAEQASSSAEQQAVAQELLSLADKAILDSQIELAKRVIERALAAARKSESDDLVKHATLVWSELESKSR